MATSYHTAIQKLYVAYFNRPADVAGLAYWQTVVEAAAGDTTAVSAAFATSAEYDAEYGDLSVAAAINQIYVNLFGRAAEMDGLVYWANAVNAGDVTMDAAVTAIAAGAQDSDRDAYNSKVTVASAFTTALNTDALAAAYSGDVALAAAKVYLAKIMTVDHVTAAVVPATLAAAVAAVVKVPFTLVNGLETLEAAMDAKAAYLKAEKTNEATIDASVGVAVDGIEAIVGGYKAATDLVKVAMLTDAVVAKANALKTAQDAAVVTQKAIDAVVGLSANIATLATAEATLKTLAAVELNADSVAAGAVASYNVKNGAAVTLAADGTVATLIELKAGALVLVTGVTEVKNPGVTALLNASIALEAAELNVAVATTAVANAQLAVNVADLDVDAVAALATVGGGMTIVVPAKAAAPTGAEITTEVAALAAFAAAAKAASDAAIGDAALKTASDNAAAAVVAFNTKVSDLALVNLSNPKIEANAALLANVKTAQTAVDALAKATAALSAADESQAEMAELNDAIDAAKAEFTAAKLNLPVDLTAVLGATSGSDIFVAGDIMVSTIVNFGLDGTDSLFIGSDYTLNKATDLKTGDNLKLEVFLIQNGLNVEVHLETEAYGSDSAAVAEQVITLTGVTVADVTLSNGILSVG